jgi:hypothetical protein
MSNNKYARDKFVIRFTEDGLRDQIFDIAKVSNRSMNAEILHRLFRSFELESELQRAHSVIDKLIGQQHDRGEE